MKYIFGLIVLVGLMGCKNGGIGSYVQKNTAISKLNQLVVIGDGDILNSSVYDTVDYYFSGYYPILPQPEPYFDLRKYTIAEIEGQPVLRDFKAFLFIQDLSDTGSKGLEMLENDLGSEVLEDKNGGIKISKDKWAYGQIIVYVYAHGHERLDSLIKVGYPSITKRIDLLYDKQVDASIYFNRPNQQWDDNIHKNHGIHMKIPQGWVEAENKENINWYRNITEKGSHNIIIYSQTYDNQDMFAKEKIKSNINKIGKEYVSSQSDESYLRINDWDLPLLTYQSEVDEKYAIENRGIWEMVNDYMGGPFVSYTVLDEKNNKVITLFGFVFEPGKDKRDNMIKINHILHTTRF